jgi:hypothetical protein
MTLKPLQVRLRLPIIINNLKHNNMKRFLLFLNLMFTLSALPAVAYDFSMLHGLKTMKGAKAEYRMEMSGYTIFVASQKGQISNPKHIEAFKKKYSIKNIVATYSETGLSAPNLIITESYQDAKIEGITNNKIHYLLQTQQDSITFFSFSIVNSRDNMLEKAVVEAFIKGELEQEIISPFTVGEVIFAGRRLEFGAGLKGRWTAPHTLEREGETISWSEFQSIEEAEYDMDNRILLDAGQDVISDDWLEVRLDGVPTEGRRIAYRWKFSDCPLIVYYAAGQVRGHNLSCRVSLSEWPVDTFFTGFFTGNFISLPVRTDKPTKIQADKVEADDVETGKDELKDLLLGFSARCLVPTGRLAEHFSAAPMIGINIDLATWNAGTVELDLGVGPVVGHKEFNYLDFDDAIITFCGDINLNYYFIEYRIGQYFTISPYFGLGGKGLFTDKVKYENEDGNKEYYTVGGFDMHGGISFNYRTIGLFAEYGFSTFERSRAVENNFGKNFAVFGLRVNLSSSQ